MNLPKTRLYLRLLGLITPFLAYWSLPAQTSPAENPPTVESVATERAPLSIDTNTFATPTQEWTLHKTNDGLHPDGNEQAMVWLMNRARSSPPDEGLFLSDTGDSGVNSAINFFGVDLAVLQAEFDAIPARQPAAFDRRIYEGSLAHSLDLIARDAQDHTNQFQRVTDAGFDFNGASASVFSYSRNSVYGHAGFNIDWGNDGGAGDGMQPGRGHRQGLMNTGSTPLTNVGIAMVEETDNSSSVGPYVTSIVYAQADANTSNHYNKFLIGTVWNDNNSNGRYDNGEGLSGVTVMPDSGTFFAVTGIAGGYAIPVSVDGSYTLTFSGGDLASPETRSASVTGQSALVVWNPEDAFSTLMTQTPPDAPSALTLNTQ